jgi:hypothetical protein
MRKLTSWRTKTAKKDYLQALIEDKKTDASNYEKESNFELGEHISHFKFGLGFVDKVMSSTKIGVFFEGSEKVLMQNFKK